MLIAEFAYNGNKNVNTNYTLFKFDCVYYLHVCFKKKANFILKLPWVNKVIKKQGGTNNNFLINLILC